MKFSLKQSFLILFCLFSLIGLSAFGLYQFYVKVPSLTLDEIYTSFKTKTHISEYLDPQTTLIKNMMDYSKDREIQFYTEENSPCLKIKIDSAQTFIEDENFSWQGRLNELSDQVLLNRDKLKFCHYACPKFVFNDYLSGSICLYFNARGDIEKIDSPLVWNF